MEKLEPWAHIGYLVGYNSTNIYHVWIPSTSIVIAVRDVTFDESTQYDANDVLTDEQLCQHVENIVQDIGLDDTEAKPPAQSGTEFIDIPAADTPCDTYGEVTPPSHRPHKAESAGIPTPPSGMSTQPVLPTLLQTPEPCTDQTSSQGTLYKVATALPELEPVEKAHTTTVGADLDPTNILESHTHSQQVAYLADIEEPMQMMGVHSAFAAGQQHGCQKLHHDKLPQAPATWADVRTHQFSMDFKNAATKEYDGLVHWGVFQPVSCWNTSSKPLPLKWVFTYKFDTDGFLQKFKA